MSEPVHHQLALGIHPGAFVQPAPPDVSTIQNGTLWVDTSVGPPCPLRYWDAAARLWRDTDAQATLDQIVPGVGDPGTTLTQTLGPQGVTPTWQTPCGAANCVDVPSMSDGSSTAPSVDQGRCGAAVAMADYLEHTYSLIASWVNSGIATAVGATLDGLLSTLEGIFFGPEVGVPGFLLQLGPLVFLAKFILGRAIGFFPALDSTDDTAILRACYQSLDGRGRSIIITQATISMWALRMHATSDLPAPEPQQLLQLILAVPSVAAWQAKAYAGAQTGSTLCAAFGTPSYAMNGGALLGRSTVSHALRGGAFMGMTGHRSMRGGGYYYRSSGQSLSGGASAT